MKFKIILFLFAAFAIGSGSFAQETTAEIQGVIKDAAGAGLVGATISAKHLPTGTVYTTVTRNNGLYNLANLRVGGPYEINVSYVGFVPARQDNIMLLLGQTFSADFQLTSESENLTMW